MIQATHEQVLRTIRWYLKRKIPFTYEVQNETLSVESPMGSYSTRSRDYTINELNFIKAVKNHIVKNNLQEPYRYRIGKSSKSVKYFQYHQKLKPNQHFENCFNIDASAAYWETANKMGLFKGGEHIYEQGLSWEKALSKIKGDRKQAEKKLNDMIKAGKSDAIRKQVRLTAIGSLAKKKRVYHFDGKKQEKKTPIRSEKTEFLWDEVAERIGNVMLKIVAECGSDFLFFWVDGIYVKPAARKKVEAAFKKAGYGCKTHAITWIKTTKRHLLLKCPEKIREREINGRIELSDEFAFPFRNREISATFNGYNTDL